jgi:hypothetical protein
MSMSNPISAAAGGSPHMPTVKTVVVIVIVLLVAYHFLHKDK